MSNYYKIKKFNTANGDGIRTAIFFCGCDFKCPNCFNVELWDSKAGQLFDEEAKKEIWLSMNNHISGLSILGGEPLSDYNLETVIELCKDFKKDFPDKNIWLWTGFTFEKLSNKQKEVLNYIDVIVDGLFIEELKEPNLKFRGSSNQRIIDLRKKI